MPSPVMRSAARNTVPTPETLVSASRDSALPTLRHKTGSTAIVAPQRVAPRQPVPSRPARSTSCSGRAAPAARSGSHGNPPLRQPRKQLVELGRVVLQRTRSRRTHRTNHPAPHRSTQTSIERNASDPREGYESDKLPLGARRQHARPRPQPRWRDR